MKLQVIRKASLRRHPLRRYLNNALRISRKNIEDEKSSQCKGPETQCAWQVRRRTKRPMSLRSKLREIGRRYAWRNNNGGIWLEEDLVQDFKQRNYRHVDLTIINRGETVDQIYLPHNLCPKYGTGIC